MLEMLRLSPDDKVEGERKQSDLQLVFATMIAIAAMLAGLGYQIAWWWLASPAVAVLILFWIMFLDTRRKLREIHESPVDDILNPIGGGGANEPPRVPDNLPLMPSRGGLGTGH